MFLPVTQVAILLVSGISIFGLSDNFTLLVTKRVSVGQLYFRRSLIAIFMIFGLRKLFGLSVIPRYWKPILLRIFLLVSAMLLYFGVMQIMPQA